MEVYRHHRKVFYIFIFMSFILISSCQKEEQVPKIYLNEKRSNPQFQEVKEEKEIPDMDLITVEKAFVSAARSAIPAVVNISTIQAVKDAANNQPNGNKGFFNGLLNLYDTAPKMEYKEKTLGSGFIVKNDGYILTNNHVIADSDKINVRLADSREFEGKVIGRDIKTDLAVLKIPSGERLPSVTFGDSNKLEVGEWAIAIGNPFGLDRTVTIGVISATGRSNLGLTDYENYIQTDAAINFGNSGGPLLNIRGEVIGVNTAIISSGQGIGFATPINSAKAILESLIFKGKIKKGWLGVGIQMISVETDRYQHEIKMNGLLVKSIIDGSPAQRDGIKVGDIIIGFNKSKLYNISQFKKMVEEYTIGESAELDLIRDAKMKNIQVIIGEIRSGGVFN